MLDFRLVASTCETHAIVTRERHEQLYKKRFLGTNPCVCT